MPPTALHSAPLIRGACAPATIFGAAAALLGAMLLYDADVLAALARLDAAHRHWHLGDILATGCIVLLTTLLLVLRRGTDLRHEIARRRRAEADTPLAGAHDALTGLPDRQMFLDAVAATLHSPAPTATVMLIGLDRFARINDLHGRAVGDLLLAATGDRLRTALPPLLQPEATLARFGGDEFAILLPAPIEAESVLRLGNRLIAAIAAPIACGTAELRPGASIGIARARQDGCDPRTLLHAAGLAMDRAKQDGPGLCRIAGIPTAPMPVTPLFPANEEAQPPMRRAA